jgi:hypothetical protein
MAEPVTGLARLMQMRDSQEVLFHRYVGEWVLSTYDPGDVWTRQTLDLASAGVTEDDGIIISLEGTRRPGGTYVVDRGQVISDEQAQQIQEFDNTPISRYAVWDVRISHVKPTSGPQEKAGLMESFEQKKKRERTEETEQQDALGSLGEGLRELTTFLRGGPSQESPNLNPQDVFEYLNNNFTSAQVQDLVAELSEKVPEQVSEEKPSGIKRKKKVQSA